MNAVVFDWKQPDYVPVFGVRAAALARIRAEPRKLPALKLFYKDNLARFISDWGVTSDPRSALLVPPQPVLRPFILFDRQEQWIDWVLERVRLKEPGLCEKSRDCGVSWLMMCVAASLCLFNRGLTIGVGSAKEDKLDRSGDPDTLFWKLRTFLKHLPPEFRGGWDEPRHSAHLRVIFPETGSAIVGEAGTNIARGGRHSITFLDESAHIPQPELIDASLASATDCRIDCSSVNGIANSFAKRRHSGKIPVFTFHWRDDPRKDDAWYKRQQETLDPVTLAAEVDIDYRASQESTLIPTAWVQSAIGAAEKLGITLSGARVAGLDIADQGGDRNAFAARYGIGLEYLESWSGKDRDIFESVAKACHLCDANDIQHLEFDATGMGAGVRGDLRVINEQRRVADKRPILDNPFVSAGEVFQPEGEQVPGQRNQDFFANLKAQSWYALRQRFQAVHRAVVEGKSVDPDSIISIRPDLPELGNLVNELSQITYKLNGSGKILIDKMPDGAASPNLADSVMLCYNPASAAAMLQLWIRLAQ